MRKKIISYLLLFIVTIMIPPAFVQAQESPPLYAGGHAELIEESPFYIRVNGELKQAGRFYKGTIIEPINATTHYLSIKANDGQHYYVDVMNTTSATSNSGLSTYSTGQHFMIQARNDFQFYNASGKALGVMSKGYKVKFIKMENGRGVVELFNKQVYVDVKDFKHDNLVDGAKKLSYDTMIQQLQLFAALYPELTKLEAYGTSVEGRTLYALRVGTGKKEILMDASTHAREHMTTNVLMEMIDQYTQSYINGTTYDGYNVKSLLDQVSIWFVPMMNPDGVMLVQQGPKGMKNEALVKKINGNASFTRWKANARGVDLNRNFDSGWQHQSTSSTPSFKNYKGTSAFSEPESRGLRDFVAKHQFKSYITYHSSGQILYWTNKQTGAARTRDHNLAKLIGNKTGYRLIPENYSLKGTAYAMDWFIKHYKMPSITVEISPYVGEREIPLSYWPSIWTKNKSIGLLAATEASKR